MIDQKFIDSAIEIRKEFIRLNEELKNKESIVEELKSFIEKKYIDLENFRQNNIKNVKTKEDVISVAKELHQKMLEIEEKEKSLSKGLNELDKRMDKLKKEESDLQRKIKLKHPELSLEEIKKEIYKYLDF